MENRVSQFVSINEKKGTTDNLLVSIITPTLNRIKYLEACIQSILNQSYPLIEHVFVDGGWSINNDTVKALIKTGITHECSATPHHKPSNYDWSKLARICMPYHPITK